MSYYKTPIIYPTGLIREDTRKINDNFTQLALVFVNNDPMTGIVKKADNADKLDGFHASQTPSANTIPIAGADGKIDSGWIKINTSNIPTPNAIPQANDNGKISDDWLNVSKNLNTSGYINLFGFIIQWGTFVCDINSITLVTLPIAFPNNFLCVVVTPLTNADFNSKPYDADQYEDNWVCYKVSLSQFRFYNGFQLAGPSNWNYIAIGY
jgi:hypothetical protein